MIDPQGNRIDDPAGRTAVASRAEEAAARCSSDVVLWLRTSVWEGERKGQSRFMLPGLKVL